MSIRIRPLEYATLLAYLRERADIEQGELGGFLSYIADCSIEPCLGSPSAVLHAHIAEQGEANVSFLRSWQGLEPE